MKRIFYFLILIGFVFCSEDPIGQTPTNNITPSQISNIQVESIPGGAKITYDLPNETDISYVKGEYIFQGKNRVVRSSIYSDAMVIEGLGSINPIEVTLYTVNHSEVTSKPQKISFIPDTPPIISIIESMKMLTDFGGVRIEWQNNTSTEIGITLFHNNDDGETEEGETYYTAVKKGQYSFRGYDTQERTFAICITDKWGNVSDTIKSIHKPMYEALLDKDKHKQYILPLDNNTSLGGWPFASLFNNIIGNNGWHTTENGSRMPLFFTIDLGLEVKLSRFKLWGRQSYEYAHHNLKFFEVWGSSSPKVGMYEDYWEDPNYIESLAVDSENWETDGTWELLGDFYTLKPSGEYTPITNDDRTFARNGFEFTIPLDKKNVRYLRFKMKANWSGGKSAHISEISFYGDNSIKNK